MIGVLRRDRWGMFFRVDRTDRDILIERDVAMERHWFRPGRGHSCANVQTRTKISAQTRPEIFHETQNSLPMIHGSARRCWLHKNGEQRTTLSLVGRCL